MKRSLDINNAGGNLNMNTPNSLRMNREVGKSPGKIFSFDKNINITQSVSVTGSKSNILSQ